MQRADEPVRDTIAGRGGASPAPRTDAKSAIRVQPSSLRAGAVVALGQIGQAAALSALIFASFSPEGASALMQLLLVASIVTTLVVTLARDLPAPIFVTVQNAPVAVLLPAIAALSVADGSTDTTVATTFAILGCAGLLAGLAIAALWAFDLGRIVNLLPFPVSAGFLAGSGAILVIESLRSLLPDTLSSLDRLLTADPVHLMAPALGAAFGLVLFAARRVAPNYGLITALLLGIGVTYAGLLLTGTEPGTARELGLLMPQADAAGAAVPLWQNWSLVDWAAVYDSAPFIAACALVAVIGSMLNLSGIEMILGRDIDASRVLGRLGGMNVLSGCLGAPPSYASASLSGVGAEIDTRGRASALVYCAILVVATIFVSSIAEVLPTFVMAGLLVFIGLALFERWFIALRGRMRLSEWLVTGTVVLVTVTFGILVAIQVGIIASSILFVASYARLRVVRDVTDLSSRRSRVDRGPAQAALLDAEGHRVKVLSLQGYLFFGSVEQVADRLRRELDATTGIRRIILDLSRVRDIDAAAAAAMGKIERLARQRHVSVVLTGLTRNVEQLLSQSGLLEADGALSNAPSLDAAIEAAERLLLESDTQGEPDEDATSTLARHMGSVDAAERLLGQLDRQTVQPGTRLIEAGSASDDVFVVDRGRLAIELPRPGASPIRLRSVRAGAFVGEMAGYLGQPRSADVVAESETVVYRVGPDVLETIRRTDPELLAMFHRMMATALAEKLDRTTRLLREADQ